MKNYSQTGQILRGIQKKKDRNIILKKKNTGQGIYATRTPYIFIKP